MKSSVLRGVNAKGHFRRGQSELYWSGKLLRSLARSLPCALAFAVFVPCLCAQQSQTPTVEMRDGGTSVQQIKKDVVAEVLESIYIPAITGAPFTAVVHTEWVRYLADGETFTLIK